MPLQAITPYPAVNEANPYTSEVQTAYDMFKKEVDASDGWETTGEKDGVKTEKKGNGNGTDLPLLRGTCIIEGITTDAVCAIVQLSGIRKVWDNRFTDAWMLRRFTPLSYQFYNLGKAPPGLGWIVNARDLSGVGQMYVDGQDDGAMGNNKEVIIVQTSVKDDTRASEQKGKTRMELFLNAWRFTPQGNDVRVTFIIKANLAGSLPATAVAGVIKELPAQVGAVRDTFYENGHPPYIAGHPNGSTPSTLQTELFSLQKPTNQYQANITGKTGGDFTIRYDNKRMYASKGITVTVKGPGKDGVVAQDDGNGAVNVEVKEAANGKNFEVFLHPKGSSVKA